MLKKIWILITLFNSMNVWSADFVKGEARFWTEQGDTALFIKEHLIFLAFSDIISKELEGLSCNKDVFWQKMDARFAEHFMPTEEALKTKFSIGAPEETSAGKREFEKELRLKKLEAKRKFSNFEEIVPQYSIQKMTRSTQYPRSRFIQIEAKVDKGHLKKLCGQMIYGNRQSDYRMLYVMTEFRLEDGLRFSDIQINNEKEMVKTLSSKWRAWLEDNKPENISAVEVMSDSQVNQLFDYQAVDFKEMNDSTPSIFVNSVLLKVVVSVRKRFSDTEVHQYEYDYNGGVYLMDLKSSKVIYQKAFDTEFVKYTSEDGSDLGSKVVNHVYRLPMGSFTEIKKALNNVSPTNRIITISMFDFMNIEKVYDLIKMLKEQGVKYSLNADLVKIKQNAAEILIQMEGNKADLFNMLKELRDRKNAPSIELIDLNNMLGVKFNQVTLKPSNT